MSKFLTISASVACMALIGTAFTRPCIAQNTGNGGIYVAVVDIGYIFKNNAAFKQQLDAVGAEIKAFEEQMNAQRSAIMAERKQLEDYDPASAQYRQLEESIARKMSDLNVSAQLKKKDVLQKEAKIYFDSYNQISAVVTQVANQYNISLVLRYDSEQIDPANRQSVLKGLNRYVVYQNQLDITSVVLKQLPGAVATNQGTTNLK